MLDADGSPLAAVPEVRELFDLLGVFKDFLVPRDASISELADVLGEMHTQLVIRDFYAHMKEAIDEAVSSRSSGARNSNLGRGILIDATQTQTCIKAHPTLPFRGL